MTNTNFKIKAIKFSPDEIEKIISFLISASRTIGADAPIDWEERIFAERKIGEAIAQIRARKGEAEAIGEAADKCADFLARMKTVAEARQNRILDEFAEYGDMSESSYY